MAQGPEFYSHRHTHTHTHTRTQAALLLSHTIPHHSDPWLPRVLHSDLYSGDLKCLLGFPTDF
jgi:hypothetical protein